MLSLWNYVVNFMHAVSAGFSCKRILEECVSEWRGRQRCSAHLGAER